MVLVKTNGTHPKTPISQIALGHNLYALVDPEWLDYLSHWHWFAKFSFHNWYAVRTERTNGKKVFIRMHRVIAHTPHDQVCHHRNGGTLDNRSKNLLNMSWYDHTKFHSHR